MAFVNHHSHIDAALVDAALDSLRKFSPRWETDDMTNRVYRYFTDKSGLGAVVWRYYGNQMEYCFVRSNIWHESYLTPECETLSEIPAEQALKMLRGYYDDEIPIYVDANVGFKCKVGVDLAREESYSVKTVVERKPVADPATEAFYRDRREAARRCMCGAPNPKDADDQRAMSRKIDVVEIREIQLRRMAELENEHQYPLQDSSEYRALVGWRGITRNGKV